MSQDARLDEERATQRRAQILQLPYADTSQINYKPLYRDLLMVDELYGLRVVPLLSEQSHIHFGITTTTSQQAISHLKQRFADVRTEFSIISDAGYRDYMRLYDPPKQVVYQDISINQADNAQQVDQISNILEQVRA